MNKIVKGLKGGSYEKNGVKVLSYYKDIGICESRNQEPAHKAELIRGEYAVMDFSLISQQIKWLMGEVLTITEAVIDDERKLKATKDIIKDKFSNKLNWIYELCGMPSNDEGLIDPED